MPGVEWKRIADETPNQGEVVFISNGRGCAYATWDSTNKVWLSDLTGKTVFSNPPMTYWRRVPRNYFDSGVDHVVLLREQMKERGW